MKALSHLSSPGFSAAIWAPLFSHSSGDIATMAFNHLLRSTLRSQVQIESPSSVSDSLIATLICSFSFVFVWVLFLFVSDVHRFRVSPLNWNLPGWILIPLPGVSFPRFSRGFLVPFFAFPTRIKLLLFTFMYVIGGRLMMKWSLIIETVLPSFSGLRPIGFYWSFFFLSLLEFSLLDLCFCVHNFRSPSSYQESISYCHLKSLMINDVRIRSQYFLWLFYCSCSLVVWGMWVLLATELSTPTSKWMMYLEFRENLIFIDLFND